MSTILETGRGPYRQQQLGLRVEETKLKRTRRGTLGAGLLHPVLFALRTQPTGDRRPDRPTTRPCRYVIHATAELDPLAGIFVVGLRRGGLALRECPFSSWVLGEIITPHVRGRRGHIAHPTPAH